MLAVRRPSAETRYRGLFPDWSGPRPLRWFFAEELLEARHRSGFPTGAAGPDEDVNVYLVHLLAAFLAGPTDPRVQPGAWALLLPPDKTLPRAARADHYRVNGDHRLLMLGLMDRGDGLRRRRVPWGVVPAAARDRDLAAGAACYRLAAGLADRGAGTPPALAGVLDRLATHFDDYVHVLGVLATRRLGLGTRLGEGELVRLLQDAPAPAGPEAAPAGAAVRAPSGGFDGLLDALSAWRARPTAAGAAELRARAAALGVDPSRLGLTAA